MGEINKGEGTEDRAIYWWCQAGDNIEKRLRWLRRNIQNKVNELGSIHLLAFFPNEESL
jgi:hypothetical protein